MKLPTKLCPCCESPLSIEYGAYSKFIYCSSGSWCKSDKANDGIEVQPKETPEHAADRLIAALLDKPDWE